MNNIFTSIKAIVALICLATALVFMMVVPYILHYFVFIPSFTYINSHIGV